MSSPTDRTEKHDEHLAYAPKWARDPHHERTHENPNIAEGEFPQHNEQSVPKEGLISDQARAHRPLDPASLREARLAPRARRPLAEGDLPEDSERPPSRRPRSLDPEVLREPPPAPRALGRLAVLAGLAIAALIGAALALFITGKFPSEFNKVLGLSTDKWAVVSRFADDTLKTPEQLSSPANRPPSTDARPIGEDSARVASGKIRLEYRPTDVFSVVRNVVDAHRPSLEARGLTYKTRIAPGKAYVMGDVNRLQQVFGNLLSNSIKVTPPGGTVTISASRSDSEVEITIADSGEGISSESLPTIFRQFSQVGAGERKSVGLGLGLSIAKTLVERHGGRVHAESDGVGKGSRFVVSLPVIETAQLERTSGGLTSSESLKLLSGLTILIVEDEHDSREVLRLYLENKGATVHQAENVAAGLKILESLDEPPNLIISDIGMPEENGLSMIKRIRASLNPSIANIPAIALSAFATGEFKDSALASGFQRYVAKPFDPKSFTQAVVEVARKT